MFTYEDAKLLYKQYDLKVGYGSFKQVNGYACPVTVYELANPSKKQLPESIDFACGFDSPNDNGDDDHIRYPESYKDGQALRRAFDRDGPVPSIYYMALSPEEAD